LDTSFHCCTVSCVLPEILPKVAVMVILSTLRSAVTRPLLSIVATDVSDEPQITWVVISLLVPSKYVPVAINCIVDSRVRNGLAGIIFMKIRGIGLTVRAALPEIEVLVMEVAVIVVVPAEAAVAKPVLLTVATDGSDELQVTCVVISKIVVSEYMPVALNCWVAPTNMVGLAGITTMEDRVAKFTVRSVFPEIEVLVMEVAVMVVVPTETAKATPVVLSIVATVISDEVQVTCVVKVVPSEYVPVAVNFRGTPTGMLGLAGVTAREDRVAVFTVRVVLPEVLPEVAVMVVVPVETAKPRPLLSIVATDGLDELQVTCVVISMLVPLLYVPMALNCCMAPTGILGLTGTTAMEDRVAEVTVRVVLPEVPLVEKLLGAVEAAVMVTVPMEAAVARPVVLSTVATNGLDELQMTCVVMSWIVWSL